MFDENEIPHCETEFDECLADVVMWKQELRYNKYFAPYCIAFDARRNLLRISRWDYGKRDVHYWNRVLEQIEASYETWKDKTYSAFTKDWEIA